MATLIVGNKRFHIELVVFDKDGTLIDFYHLWAKKARLAVDALAERANGDVELAKTLYRAIGYAPDTGLVDGAGPLATATMPKIYTIAATILYQHGMSWHESERWVEESFAAGLGALPTADLVRPLGDIAGLFQRLTRAGIQIALATSDDRTATEETLSLLGVDGEVSLMTCGDDGMPSKPAPDTIWYLGNALGVEPTNIMMVGDTVGDMVTGTRAGVGARVAVTSGTESKDALAEHADTLIESVDQIRVAT